LTNSFTDHCDVLDEVDDLNRTIIKHSLLSFVKGQRGCKLLAFNGHNYVRNRRSGLKTYWICSKKVCLRS